MLKSNPLLSLVVPLYNEEENVSILCEKVERALTNYKYELILIDDCSNDNTKENIKSLKNPNVTLIELKKNYGQSLAMSAGFDFANGDYIITLDGDLQNDPTDIPKMVNKLIEEDVDVVTGYRKNRKDSILKTFPSKIANFLIRKLTKMKIKDQGCALKVFTRETAKSLKLYGEMHRFINLAAYLDGAKISEIKVLHHPRRYGVSKYGLSRTFKVVNDLLLILFQRKFLQKPIYFFGNIGLIIFSVGSILGIYFLIIRIMGEDIWGRPLLILAVLLIIVGIQFFSIGILYDLLMKTYFESQDKKPYRIRKVFKFDA